jgi:hypothetical protein
LHSLSGKNGNSGFVRRKREEGNEVEERGKKNEEKEVNPRRRHR